MSAVKEVLRGRFVRPTGGRRGKRGCGRWSAREGMRLRDWI